VSSERVLHPKHGPHNPSVFTPSRRPNSVRRTTTHDSLRPDGLLGDVHLVATGRDLRTDADGQAAVVATARLDATIEYIPERLVTTISVDPPAEGIERLVGVRASSGFRQAVDDNVPDARTHSLRYQLLDDVPTALLVSGYTIGAGGVSMRPRGGLRLQHPDLCAGWATGGTILVEMEATGQVPVVTGPEAPSLRRDDDDLAWHQLSPLPAHGMRRSRRLDVWEGKGVIAVECFFRDSHFAADGLETVVHEYTVDASIDPETRRFLSCDTTVGALPWIECPGAVGSSERLIGAPAEGLRPWVRETFVGPTTCTHLNDTLRSLEGVPDLLAILAQDGLS
jgi:Protein of unknown function (DUF2889)